MRVLEEAAQRAQARIAIESQNVVRPIAKILDQVSNADTGENCRGG